jgi:hypothetical protein
MALPTMIRVTDQTTRAELEEALGNLVHAAKRETPRLGYTLANGTRIETRWDVAHARIDALLAEWRTAPA